MNGKKGNSLIIIENGQLRTYFLDDRLTWEVGRPSKDNQPDIKLYSATVSRKHGRFQNMDGIWFYLDNNGKNGTVYNNKHIKAGLNGRVKPVMLKDGDVFIFGGDEQAVINCKTIWAMFSTHGCEEHWRVTDTKGYTELAFTNGEKVTRYEKPAKGTIVKQGDAIAVYMGDITYLSGEISVIGS